MRVPADQDLSERKARRATRTSSSRLSTRTGPQLMISSWFPDSTNLDHRQLRITAAFLHSRSIQTPCYCSLTSFMNESRYLRMADNRVHLSPYVCWAFIACYRNLKASSILRRKEPNRALVYCSTPCSFTSNFSLHLISRI